MGRRLAILFSTFVMFEIFHNKQERKKKGRQSQKLDTKPAALVNRSDGLGMPITCPQRPLSQACRWFSRGRKRGQSMTLKAISNTVSQAPLSSNSWLCPENKVTSLTSLEMVRPYFHSPYLSQKPRSHECLAPLLHRGS